MIAWAESPRSIRLKDDTLAFSTTAMSPEPVLLAIAHVVASVSSSYLTTSPQYSVDQRRRAEWAAWGLLALCCRIRLRRRPAGADSGADKEAQLVERRQVADLTAWCIALLLAAAQFIALRVGRPAIQWAFVS